MNPKIEKLKAEREKNCNKINALQARNREIDEAVRSLENANIVGLVREQGLTPEMLAELLASLKQAPLSAGNPKNKEESHENEKEI